ncbi:glycosyltransferase family 2 protein [Candidatus Woesearchaeota archaeon]|nr:glycosyltransferase family 2 protein [Candidatus Woesearchaeota archaeon]
MTDGKDNVLVACIVYDDNKHCFEDFWNALSAQEIGCETLFIDCSGSEECNKALNKTGAKVLKGEHSQDRTQSLVDARNAVKKHFLDRDHTHLLFIEPDIMLPERAISKLLFNGKDIVSGVCLSNMRIGDHYEIAPTLFDFAGDDSVRMMELKEVLDGRLIEIFGSGLGCTLIKRTVLDKVNFRSMPNGTGDDIAFFVDARQQGFDAFADTKVKCNRMVKPKGNPANDVFSFDAYPGIRDPRVLVACVTHDKDSIYLNGFLESIRSQDYHNHDILFVDTSAADEFTAKLKGSGAIVLKGEPELDHSIKKVTSGREIARKYAVEKGYDYLWFVDTDVMPKKDALSSLLARRKDLIAGVCLSPRNINGTNRVMPNIYDFDDEEGYCRPMWLNEVMEKRLVEVSCAGFGCTLMTGKVMGDIKLRYYENSMAGEDIAYFVDAREKGFRTFADTGVRCSHLVFPPGDPRNRKFLFESYEKGTSYDIKVDNIMKD